MRSIGIALASLLLLPQVAMAHPRGERVVVSGPRGGRVVVAPPGRGVVVGPPRGRVRIGIAPPPVRVEVRGVRPSPRHVWRSGYWGWRNGAHYWVAGGSILPPVVGEVWVPAGWSSVGGEWEFHDGYWSNPAYEEPVVETAPPAPVVETAPPPPQQGWVWQAGHWQWHGNRYRWVPGHYVQPRAGYSWVPGQWVPAGNHWRWVRGHWQ